MGRKTEGKAARGSASGDAGGGAPPPVDLSNLEWQREFFLERRMEEARIPRRFWKKTIENFDTRDPVKPRRGTELKSIAQIVALFVQQFNFAPGKEYPRGLLFTGPVGCGKSHLAAGILREIVRKGYSGIFYNSPDLLRDIRATFRDDSDVSEDELLASVTNVDLLVLDDLGVEKVTDFVLDRFYLIVNKRYEGCKPIIVTMNLDEETLRGRLGDRVVSRLHEMCNWVRFPEDDFRMRPFNEMKRQDKLGGSSQ